MNAKDVRWMTTLVFAEATDHANPKIVELLLADGKVLEALQAAEQAKARSLQDLLAARGGKPTIAHGPTHWRRWSIGSISTAPSGATGSINSKTC